MSAIVYKAIKDLPQKNDTGVVKVPFREGYFAVSKSASASANFVEAGIIENGDGTGTAISITVPSGQNGATIRFPFYGRVFGIRHRYDSNFSVAIDGVSYGEVSGKHTYLVNEGMTVTDGESLIILDEDLPDGVHYAEIMVVAPTSGTNTVVLYGFLAEARVGYKERQSTNYFVTPAAVPTTSTSVGRNTYPKTLRSVRKIIYTNTTASPITITVYSNTTVMWSKSVPANDTIEMDFGERMSVDITFKHMASATGVNSTVVGGM